MRDFLRDKQQDGGAGGFLQVQAPEHRRKDSLLRMEDLHNLRRKRLSILNGFPRKKKY